MVTTKPVSMNVKRDQEFDLEEYTFGTPCYPNLPQLGDNYEYRLVITKREFMSSIYYNVAAKLSPGDMFPKPVPDSFIGGGKLPGASRVLSLSGGTSSVFDSYEKAAEVYNKVVQEMQKEVETWNLRMLKTMPREMMCRRCLNTFEWVAISGNMLPPKGVIRDETKIKPWGYYDDCLCNDCHRP
jgi:hypothetical protein